LAQLPLVTRLQNLVFDGYQQLSPRPWQPDLPVRIIDIDEPSLAYYGQWPWPRDRMAQLTRKLQEFGAAAIGFDVIFAEKDQTSPGEALISIDFSILANLIPPVCHTLVAE